LTQLIRLRVTKRLVTQRLLAEDEHMFDGITETTSEFLEVDLALM
jgi:hypothetical protein